jgi:hypothetical protein
MKKFILKIQKNFSLQESTSGQRYERFVFNLEGSGNLDQKGMSNKALEISTPQVTV